MPSWSLPGLWKAPSEALDKETQSPSQPRDSSARKLIQGTLIPPKSLRTEIVSSRARLEVALTTTYGSSLMYPQSLQGYARLRALPRAGECRDE